MADNLLLDNESAKAFRSLYPNDILECTDGRHLSFGAFYNEHPAALFVIRLEEDTLMVEWLYTLPEFRNKGLMTDLMAYAFRICSYNSVTPVVQVLCDQKDLISFLEEMGFFFNSLAGTRYTGSLKDMRSIKTGKHSSDSRPLSSLNEKELNIMNNELYRAADLVSGLKLPVKAQDYHDSSRVCLADNQLKALILLRHDTEGIVDISYAYKANGSEISFMLLLSDVRDELLQTFPEDTLIRTVTLNDSSEKLFTGLFEAPEKEFIYLGEQLIL